MFLTALEVPFEYEVETYKARRALVSSDFWIQSWNLFIEVKGKQPTAQERIGCALLADAAKAGVMLAVGSPGE